MLCKKSYVPSTKILFNIVQFSYPDITVIGISKNKNLWFECNAGDPVLIPGWGRFPEEGNGNPKPGRVQSMGSQRVGHDWVTNLTSHHLRFVISIVETVATVMENLDCLRSQPWLGGADHVLEPYSSPLQELLEAQLSKVSRGNDSFLNTKLFEYSERRKKVIQHKTFFRGIQALWHKVINDHDMSQSDRTTSLLN